MSIAYFDCFAGIAGDMIVGALCDLGLPFRHVERGLGRLGLPGYRVRRRRERRGGIGGIKFSVVTQHTGHSHRAYASIHRMIGRSGLPRPVRATAQAIFHRLAVAEGRAHHVPVAKVHFHEVGAVDSIVDIVGTAIGLHYFDFDAIYASPLPMARGFVQTEHGRLPLPPPATAALVRGMPLQPAPVRAELVTPTGAAVLAVVATGFGECPLRRIDRIGYGLGDREFRFVPNVLRIMVGMGAPTLVVEANIDDSSPQMYEYLIETLLRQGALDVTVRPVWMKKRRPGAQVQAVCEESSREAVIRTIVRETTSFGVRYYPVERRMLTRSVLPVRTQYGTVRVKRGFAGPKPGKGELLQASPEYEDCKRLARKTGVPLRAIYRVAMAAAMR